MKPLTTHTAVTAQRATASSELVQIIAEMQRKLDDLEKRVKALEGA